MLIFLLSILLGLSQTDDNIQHVNYYLHHPKVSKAAKDYYYKKFKATDDDRTFSIFDSLKTKNSETRPFYIFLCAKIMENADGALAEASGAYAKEFVETHPKLFITFFNSNRLHDSSRFFNIWAKAVAGEIQIECEGPEKSCLEQMTTKMNLQISKKEVLLQKKMMLFEKLVRTYLP